MQQTRYSIAQASEKLDLAEAELRYYLLHFQILPGATEPGSAPEMQRLREADLAALRRIDHLLKHDRLSPEQVKEVLSRQDPGIGPSSQRQASVVGIVSGGAGAGASVFALNLAAALEAKGSRVLVFDGQETSAPGQLLETDQSGVLVFHPSRAGKLDEPAPEIREHDATCDFILGETGSRQIETALRYAAASDEILAVTTPEVAANAECLAVIRALHEVDPALPVSIVMNRARSLGEAREAFARLSAASRRLLGRELPGLGWLPEDPMIQQASLQGRTVLAAAPGSAAAESFSRLADALRNRLTPVPRRKRAGMEALMEAFGRSSAPGHAAPPRQAKLAQAAP